MVIAPFVNPEGLPAVVRRAELRCLRAAVLAALLMAVPPAFLAALSVIDVIRMSKEGYPDEEIVRLIQVTDSRFALSGEDAVRLKKEGVSEAVIREMLGRPAEKEAAPAAAEDRHEHATKQPRARAPLRSRQHDVLAERRAEMLFSASNYEEAGAGHHVHAALLLADLEVLILREEASFPSPLDRAQSLAGKLNKLAAYPEGRFQARGARIAFDSPGGTLEEILEVTSGDVAAYRVRSRPKIGPETLASFWSALLNDYWLIAIAGEPPRHLINSHEGEGLEELYRALDPKGPYAKRQEISEALASLPQAEQEHLRKLPTAVPENREFSPRRSP